MSKKWVVSAKRADFDAIAAKFHISPYLARIIRNRDVIGDENVNLYLNGEPKDMHDPSLLKDIEIAKDIISDAVEAGVKIRIVGDYDIDGVCASHILHTGISYLGGNVDVRLPDRILDGYGINENIIREASADDIELIITCDNGIAAAKEVQLANDLGMSVIITDHHEVPFSEENGIKEYIIPNADAVIDPKQEECNYPFSGICGAMVAYKLISYMLKDYEGADEKELLEELFSFAAFATVGDVMELVDENRIAVKHGIEILKKTTNLGMKTLMEVTGVHKDVLSAYHIGFILGPCINASGRLDTARRALELFSCLDKGQATVISKELYDLNESRKNMTVSFANAAIKMAQEEYMDDKVLVIFLPSCHESIAGIVAGRIREKFYKPAIVLTLDAEGGVKGSGRSIESYNMFDELTKVKDIFTKFGGHKMAAGMSLSRDKVDELRRRLNDNCQLSDEDLVEKMVIDIPLPIGLVTEGFVKENDKLAPFGVANPKPLFAQKDVAIRQMQLIGKNKNVLKLILDGVNKDNNHINVEAVLFNNAEEAYEKIKERDKISILYQIGMNEYMGNRTVQLLIQDYM